MIDQRFDGGEAILQACRNLDVDYIVSSPGSDWGSVWEALGRQKLQGQAGPTYLNCGHELLAVDLAAGYTAMTGRMQAVLLHAGVGVLQGAMGLYGARLAELPMLVMSGESTSFGVGQAFEPGAQWYNNHNVAGGLHTLVHPLFKWAHRVGSASILYESVLRAGQIARSLPVGPAYLDIPLEMMAAPCAPRRMRKAPPTPRLRPLIADVEHVADMLLAAKRPMAITGSMRSPDGYDALIELAGLLALPVFESPSSDVGSFPRDHPLHAGFDPTASLKDADLVLVVRSRTPWYPLASGPIEANVVVIDEMPIKLHMAHQDLRADAMLCGDACASLQLLADAVRAVVQQGPARRAVEERRTRVRRAREEARDRQAAVIAAARATPRIHPIALCAALGDTLAADTIYVDETTVHLGLNRRYLEHRGAQSYLAMRSGLGQGIGIALGVKLARRERFVACLIGDGAFVYNPMIACFGMARDAKLPLLIVIYNNHGYRAMRDCQLAYYPDGTGARQGLFYGEPIHEVDYEALIRPFGGFGISVDERAALAPALEQAQRAVADGTTAVVNVHVTDLD
jgi:acetolactate synthase I/II/III large subunit